MVESIQKKLLRVRPPRVKITYDVHTGGAIEKRELPFIVGIFADLTGDLDPSQPDVRGDYKERRMVDIDRDNFNDVLRSCQPRAALANIENVMGPNTLINPIVFASLEDFEPLNVVKKVKAMSDVYEQRQLLRELQARGEVDDSAAKGLEDACAAFSKPGADLTKLPDDLSAVIDGLPIDNARKDKLKAAFIGRVLPLYKAPPAGKDGNVPPPPAKDKVAAAVIDLAVSQIDGLLSRQLSLVMHHDSFKALEATWRGMFYLVSRTETGVMLKLRVLNAKEADLRGDMEKAVEFDQSHLFKMIYEAEYGTLGGNPYSLLVGDFEIKPDKNSLSFLRKMSEVAAAAHAPFITAAAPEIFDLQGGFSGLAKPRDLAKIFEKASMIEWQEFRDSEDSRYVTLVMPRALLRLPYGEKSNPVDGIGFEEIVNPDLVTDDDIKNANDTVAAAKKNATLKALLDLQDAQLTAQKKADESQTALTVAGDALAKAKAADKDARKADYDKASDALKTDATALVEAQLATQKALVAVEEEADADEDTPGANSLYQAYLKAQDVLSKAKAPKTGTVDNNKFLWGNAAYFLAERITNAFSLYSWTAAIRGVEGGGLVEGLPLYTYSTSNDSDGIVELFCPTEVAITDRREKEINDLGFIALCHNKGSGKAVFFGGQTSNKPKKYINNDANANAALSARLPYILAASRFAHYIKVIVRDKVGGFLTRATLEQYLNTWIAQYILLDDGASQEVKAGFPLRSAQVVVVDVPGSPGAYKATLFLKPHFQLEELTTSIRLVADLPA